MIFDVSDMGRTKKAVHVDFSVRSSGPSEPPIDHDYQFDLQCQIPDRIDPGDMFRVVSSAALFKLFYNEQKYVLFPQNDAVLHVDSSTRYFSVSLARYLGMFCVRYCTYILSS